MTPPPADLLARHQPILLATRGDPFLAGVVVYAERVGAWLEYWLAWPGDPDHPGVDWEYAAVRVNDDDAPVELVLARHRTADRRPWARVEVDGDRPRVYVGRQKHASYFKRGIYRHGRHLELALGTVRVDAPLELGAPAAVRRRLQFRDPARWLFVVDR